MKSYKQRLTAKRVAMYFATFLCFLSQGCSNSCADKFFVFTVRNESMDTVYDAPAAMSNAFPDADYHFLLLPPGAERPAEAYQSDVDYDGFYDYVIRKAIVDKYGMDKIIQERIYDTVYVCHSYDELRGRGFVLKIRQEDFKNSPYGVDGDLCPW